MALHPHAPCRVQRASPAATNRAARVTSRAYQHVRCRGDRRHVRDLGWAARAVPGGGGAPPCLRIHARTACRGPRCFPLNGCGSILEGACAGSPTDLTGRSPRSAIPCRLNETFRRHSGTRMPGRCRMRYARLSRADVEPFVHGVLLPAFACFQWSRFWAGWSFPLVPPCYRRRQRQVGIAGLRARSRFPSTRSSGSGWLIPIAPSSVAERLPNRSSGVRRCSGCV